MADVKIYKDKYINRWVDWENLVYVRWISIKNRAQRRWSIGGKIKTGNEVKQVENK